jgi:hypothetical protein
VLYSSLRQEGFGDPNPDHDFGALTLVFHFSDTPHSMHGQATAYKVSVKSLTSWNA